MSNLPLAISERELNALTESMDALQVEVAGDIPSCAERTKLSARDILATLSSRRIFISEIQFIGESPRDCGTYGDVVVATFVKAGGDEEQGRRVAVKKLRFIINGDMTEEKFLRVFVNELRVLDNLSHPNIVEIVGFVEDIENRTAWLVFPWEENGNLREFLRSEEWEIPERVSLVLDVALGLEYLHTHQPPICHGDLKSLNILVNSSNRGVITDFGSARIIRRTQEANANPGTQPAASASHNRPESEDIPQLKITTSDTVLTLTGPACSLRWSPPEVLTGESLDLATDIWALGWVAWEAITDCYPFEEVKGDWSISMKIIEGRLPLIRDHAQLSQIYPLCSMMQKCWKLEPKERPSVTECRKALWLMPWSIPVISREKYKIRSVALLLQVGQMHRSQERYEEASKAYREGFTISRDPMTAEFGDVLVELGRNKLERSEHVEPEAAYPEALAIHESLRGDFDLANGLRHEHARRARSEEPSYTQAMSTYNMMVEKLGLANTFRGVGQEQLSFANTFCGLGQEQRARSMYVSAEESYTQALALYESVGNTLGRAHALRGLGGVQLAQYNYIEAEASYTHALAIYQSVGDDPGRAGCSLGLGQIRLRQAQYAEAKTLITNASTISEEIDYSWGKRFSKQLLEEVDEAEKAPIFMS